MKEEKIEHMHIGKSSNVELKPLYRNTYEPLLYFSNVQASNIPYLQIPITLRGSM